jgi:hypothetical protein
MGDDATTRREFMRFLYRGTIGSRLDEFFNDAPANEPKAKPDTGSIARDPLHLEMCAKENPIAKKFLALIF